MKSGGLTRSDQPVLGAAWYWLVLLAGRASWWADQWRGPPARQADLHALERDRLDQDLARTLGQQSQTSVRRVRPQWRARDRLEPVRCPEWDLSSASLSGTSPTSTASNWPAATSPRKPVWRGRRATCPGRCGAGRLRYRLSAKMTTANTTLTRPASTKDAPTHAIIRWPRSCS